MSQPSGNKTFNGALPRKFFRGWLFLFLVFSSFRAHSQQTYLKTFGGISQEWAYDLIKVSSGGYLVTGFTDSYGGGQTDMFLTRLNEAGDTIWNRVYGGINSELGYCVAEAPNGGFWVGGKTATASFGNYDYLFFRTDSLGYPVFTNQIGGAGSEELNTFLVTPDSGYIVAGWSSSYSQGGTDYYVTKYKGDNLISWSFYYGGPGGETMYDMVQDTVNGGFLLVGNTASFGTGSNSTYLIKIDSVGNMLWNKAYGFTGLTEARSAKLLPNGDYLVGGQCRSMTTGFFQDFCLMKINSVGDTLWTKTYGGNKRDYIESISLTSDGGAILCGTVELGSSNHDILIVRVDSVGDTLWTRRLGSIWFDYLYKMIETPTGDFIGAGSFSGIAQATEDILLLRLDSMGNGLCSGIIPYTVRIGTRSLIISSGGATVTGYINANPSYPPVMGPVISSITCATCTVPIGAFNHNVFALDVSFTDQSLFTTAWNWDFGDGQTSTLKNPFHQYTGSGNYIVKLISCNVCATDTTVDTVTINCPLPSSGFSFTDSLIWINLTDTSTGVISWEYDFGDGTTSTLPNPSHTYAGAGTYNVCQVTQNLCGSDTTCEVIILNCPMPYANFTFADTLLDVTFQGFTANADSSWWNFGDGTTTDTAANPVHSYAAPGVYNVCYFSQNVCGMDTACQLIQVNCPAPVSSWSPSIGGMTVTFTNNSGPVGSTSFWDFGDGNTSTLSNPVNVYSTAGSYNVCLTTTSCGSADIVCQTLLVGCTLPVADFNATSNSLNANFTDQSDTTVTNWLWNFGDGTYSSQQNPPTHTYPAQGFYTVCLISSNLCGSDTLCQIIEILLNGISIQNDAKDFILFPNPNNGSFVIRVPDNFRAEKLEVFSDDGRMIFTESESLLNNKEIPLTISEISSGMYLARLQSESGILTRRFIVK